MSKNTLPLTILIEKFASLPGIGYKSATRLAYHILTLPEEEVVSISNALLNAHQKIKNCDICGNYTDSKFCVVCEDTRRDKNIICVVEDAKDISAFERTKEYVGVYHILGGLISPMDGIGPDQLHIKELLARATNNDVKEVIMATNPTVEGEATAMYLSKLLKPFDIIVSRIAYGIPVGADLEYTDEVTLFKALQNRSLL